MNEQQINIAIAEAVGWKYEESENSEGPCLRWTPPPGTLWQWNTNLYQPPNYCGDLNAMHEAEKWLWGTLEQYRNDPVYRRRWQHYEYLLHRNISASAMQRATAFVRALNLEPKSK